MPYAQIDDFKLHYKDFTPQHPDQNRPPVIMLHGFTVDHRMWLDDAQFLSRWYHAILPDFRGHGLSGSTQSGYSRAHRVEDMIALMDALSIQRVHLVGLSMGGTTALGMALAHPDRLASLTLVSTSAAGYDSGIKIKKIDEVARKQGIEAARKRWIQSSLRYFPSDKRHVRDLLEKMMSEHSGAFWADPMRGKYPAEDDLPLVHRIKLPTLVLAGELDRPFVPLAKMLHEKIEGSRLEIYSDIGHMLNLEAPNRFRNDLKVFLEGDKA